MSWPIPYGQEVCSVASPFPPPPTFILPMVAQPEHLQQRGVEGPSKKSKSNGQTPLPQAIG